jgi:hypothetical protein
MEAKTLQKRRMAINYRKGRQTMDAKELDFIPINERPEGLPASKKQSTTQYGPQPTRLENKKKATQ